MSTRRIAFGMLCVFGVVSVSFVEARSTTAIMLSDAEAESVWGDTSNYCSKDYTCDQNFKVASDKCGWCVNSQSYKRCCETALPVGAICTYSSTSACAVNDAEPDAMKGDLSSPSTCESCQASEPEDSGKCNLKEADSGSNECQW